MKSMAVTKSDMALLSQEQLTQATFGALCQSFAMQIFDRSGYEDGMYQRVALEFLEEEPEQARQPMQNVFNIDLNLVLETIRKEAQDRKREKKETEKLLEQVLKIQQAAERKQNEFRQSSSAERYYMLAPQHTTITRQSITVHNSFHQHGAAAQATAAKRQALQAAGQAEQALHAQFEQAEKQPQRVPGGPGSLSSRTAQFVKQMQEGRDLTRPGAAQPQEQPVILGRMIEQAPSLQQAVRPAAEMELKAEPVQEPENGKTTAEAVAEAMKTAVERQLQQMQPTPVAEQTSKQRQPGPQENRQQSQPSAQQEQGHPIAKQTTGPEAQQPQSVTHIQQQEQPAKPDVLQSRPERDPRQSETISRLNMPLDKEATLTTAREIRVTDQQTGSSQDVPRQEPVQQQPAFDPRSREELSFRQTEETVPQSIETTKTGRQAQQMAEDQTGGKQAASHPTSQRQPAHMKFLPSGLTEADLAFLSENQRKQLLQQENLTQNTSIRIQQPLMQSIREDIRTAGSSPDPVMVRKSEEPEKPSVFPSQTSAGTDRLTHHEPTAEAERIPPQSVRETAHSVGQRDIRVGGSGITPSAAEAQTAQPGVPAAFPPVDGAAELTFRLEAENQAADQTQTADQQKQRTAAVQPQPKSGQAFAVNQTEANRQSLSDNQRVQPVGQRDIRVAGSGLEPSIAQEQAGHTDIPAAAFSPAGETEELTFHQDADAQTASRPEPSKTQNTAAAQPQQSKTDRPLAPEYTNLLRTFAPGLTEADLQFLSDSQREQVIEAIRQGVQPVVGQRDIRVAGSGLEPSTTQKQAGHTDVPAAAFSPAGGTEELTFRQDVETKTASQPELSQIQNTAAVPSQQSKTDRPLAPEYTNLLRTFAPGLTEADLQFLSDNQRKQVQEAIRQGAQLAGQRDIRVTGSSPEAALVREQPGTAMPFPPEGGTEELTFHQDTETKTAPQPKPSKMQNTAAVPPQHFKTERPLAPEYTNLLRTFAAGLTEADLQFLSESQRAQVREVIKQGAQPVGQRDIRVTGSGLDTTAAPVSNESAADQSAMWTDGLRPEELTFRQEAEAQNASAVSEVVRMAQETQQRAGKMPSVNSPHSADRDIRVLTEHGSNRPIRQDTEQPNGIFIRDLTAADLEFLTESQRQQAAQSELHQPKVETAAQMLQAAEMEELHHRQIQPEEPGSQVQTRQSGIRSGLPDIRILRQLGHPGQPMGQQSPEVQNTVQTARYPEPVAMQLPTGSDMGRQAQPGQAPEPVNQSPMDLTYGPAMVPQQSQPPKDPTTPAAAAQATSSYVSGLPQWAQNFVKNASPQPAGITPPAPMSGVARDIASLSGNGTGADAQMLDWSAPNRTQLTNQATRRPAEVVFKETNREENWQSRPVQMSESELRRTADKIYQIIEDRIRRERRLLGL